MPWVGFAGAKQHPAHRHEARQGDRAGDANDDEVSPEWTGQMMVHSNLQLVLGSTVPLHFAFARSVATCAAVIGLPWLPHELRS